MARSINTANISLRHMDWNGDALHIYICQAKNDQEGEKSDFPKHVFANPVMPEICPILAIGIYFLVIRFEPNQSKLFEGSNQADRFRQILQRLCALDAVRPSLADLGFDSAKLGVQPERERQLFALLDLLTLPVKLQLISEVVGVKVKSKTFISITRQLEIDALGERFLVCREMM